MNGALINHRGIIYLLYAINFLLAFSIALPAYINSTFMEQFAGEAYVGIIFTLGSALTLFAFIQIPRILHRFGNYRTTIALLLLQIAALAALAVGDTIFFIAPVFLLYWMAIPLISFTLDVFLESHTDNKTTGRTRGLFFTAANLAWIAAPATAGAILSNGDYWKIYLVAGLFLLPILFLARSGLKKFKDPAYNKVPFWSTLRHIQQRKDIRNIFMADFLLWFFYSWMLIYTPIYLHEHIGFEWSQLGPMFTIMLLPFLLLQFPAGQLADTKWGEKELLSAGFIIMAIATGSLSFITSTSFIVWALALFATRVGASLIEIMTESYFFKKIDSTDTHILSIYRNNRSIAYIIAPILASVFLYFFDLKYIFLTLGLIMLLGLRYSLTLTDTK